jgi:hypothetical protein
MADALTKTTTLQFPFQPTGKRTEKLVNEVTPVQTKKRGRPPKAGKSRERAHDLVACNNEHSGKNMLLFSINFYINSKLFWN